MRAFISQLRPPLLAELGLDGSIEDGVATMRALTGATIETDLAAPATLLSDEGQVVVLRVMQEALQNVRRHAEARHGAREHPARARTPGPWRCPTTAAASTWTP